jgi:RNA polymerase sigma-70 factor (ECF subfamily)
MSRTQTVPIAGSFGRHAGGRVEFVVSTVRTDELEADFTDLFRREYAQVTRTVAFIVRDRERAEDIAQDAFVQLLRHWPKVARYERPDAWVRRIAIRLAMRVVRRDRLWSVIKRDVRQALPVQPRDVDVMEAVGRLPGMQRAAVVLFYYEDRPIAEIAKMLGCAEPTTRVHLHRGRRRLAELLGEEDPDAA